MTNWKTYKLGDIGRIVTGKTPKTSILENYGGNIPFLTPSDDLSGKHSPATAKTLTQQGLLEVKNCLLPANSVCVSCIGSDLGKVVKVIQPTVTNQQFNSIIPSDDFDTDFVYYLMTIVGKQLNYLSKTSTAVPIINKTLFSNVEVQIPPLEEQRRIAGILGAIDDKIENNRRINTNLELQAQALFEEWCESCSKTITIKEFADNILDYTPNANSKVVLLNSSDVTQGLFAELPLVDNVNLKGQFKKRFQKDDILYSEIRPRNKHYAYCYFDSDRYIASTRLIVLRGKKEKIVSNTLLYQYLISQTVFEEFTLKTETRSGTFPQGNYQDLSSIVVPYSDNQKEIAGSLDVIYEEIWSNYKENETLATLRDTLLPKLMNGEIKL